MSAMFHYAQYRSTDVALSRKFVARFPLATITSVREGAWHCSHVPLFFDEDRNELFGHVDARNGHFSTSEPLASYLVFGGTDAYIPPEGYATRQLPTWNYLAVHAEGVVSVVEDEAQNLAILKRTAMQLSPAPKSFRVEASDVRVQQWIGGIRGLRVAINNIEGRFKLSQDKQASDVQAAARHFARAVGERSSPERLLEFSGLSLFEAALS